MKVMRTVLQRLGNHASVRHPEATRALREVLSAGTLQLNLGSKSALIGTST
jgi:hypothetical protein